MGKKKQHPSHLNAQRLFTFTVYLFDGPVSEEFAEKNPVVSRMIQIRGDQILENLHYAIFYAFDREEQHMYEFQFGGKRPMDPKAMCYVLSGMFEIKSRRKLAGDVTHTKIDSLGLKVDDIFGYWFDYGDNWWHQVNVIAIEDQIPRGRFPKVIGREGESPPQYEPLEEDKE
jgi:hypothetical protein